MSTPQRISSLWKVEDYWAIWLGFALLIVGLGLFLSNPPEDMEQKIRQANTALQEEARAAPFKTIAWHQANDAKKKIKASSEGYAKTVANWLEKPHGWGTNPIKAFVFTEEQAEAKQSAAEERLLSAQTKTEKALKIAEVAERAARLQEFQNERLNEKAVAAIAEWREAKNAEASAMNASSVSPYNQIGYLLGLGIFFALFFGIGIKFMEQPVSRFFAGFPFVFLIAVLAFLMANQETMNAYGIGYAAWAIIIGLLISNTIGTPTWAKPAVQTEFYIKTGLVLLGAEILFGKILAIGLPGIFVAWVVTPTILIVTYLFGQKILKITSKTLNITICADMSVCGVSAAIATAAACKAKKEELTLAVGLSLIFTSIMMIVMPWVINSSGMDHVLGGAWMGGTIDATGAVAAAGAFLGDRALHVAATIKMIQNVLIGVIAFCVAVYWSAKIDREAGTEVTAVEIWRRFPKFVLGFLAASILFSSLYQYLGQDIGYVLIDNGVIRGFTKDFRGWFFCLAFVSIGLATNFRELKTHFTGGKPLILYVCGQTLNLILTLAVAYIMFYLIFPEITAKI